MWLTPQERLALSLLGLAALLALGILVWQRRTPPVTIEGSPTPPEAAHWEAALAMSRQIDVNTASVAELERLPGVGPSLARRIVEYRTTHGHFRTPEELSQVPGIGLKTVETLRDYVEVNE